MKHVSIKDKILDHLHGLNEVERKYGSDRLVEILSERYNVHENIVRMAIAEWQAGKSS